MGERAGNANLGEVALTLRALYGVESNLRLDRIRAVSDRVRELSGYALEPWKPRHGRDALPPRERSRREPVPRPAVDRALLVRARRAPSARSCSARRAASTRSGSRPAELGLDFPEERHAELLAAVKQLGSRPTAGSSPTTSSPSLARPGAVIERVCIAGSGRDREPVRRSSGAGRRRLGARPTATSMRAPLNERGPPRYRPLATSHGELTAATDAADAPRRPISCSSAAREPTWRRSAALSRAIFRTPP